MTEQMNVPKLRFGEFKDHVAKPKKLGQLVDMRSGNTPSKSNPKFWEGTIPWISASSMKGNVFSESEQNVTQLALENGAKLATKGSILLLVRGSMLFNKIPVGFAGCDVTYNQDVKAINLKSGDDNSYLFHWFKANEYRLLSMVTGTGIGAGKLDSDELLSLPFHQPKPAEQQKIVSFLSKVDEKITLLTEKKNKLTEYKKGVMQQLFNGSFQEQGGQLTFIPPTLRFKADDGSEFPDWEERKLGELGQFKNGLNKGKEDFGFGSPFVNLQDVFGKQVISSTSNLGLVNASDKDIDLYQLLKGDVIFIRSSVKKSGVGETALVEKNLVKTVYSGFLIRFRSNTDLTDNYKKYCFWEKRFRNKLIAMSTTSANTNINQESLSQLTIPCPSQDEQTKIANFLSSIDQKIDLVSSELEKTKEWKKGLLQQMFV
ncbi:restriction endonuclease subunit S [Vibrio alginolyticus]|uniref:restriction endonuclease subunit S n=1 Tax=Vibrio alginolyticus TaxID=663 RepID=UPI001BD40A9B|nr:restriction endonuclease subunit S [Vibrio alginolyticus]EHL0150396.1 restriction endonuclease subunit S [Vibrio parahaemolyticus]MBS9862042.1 restriction endonuclease subunit S [Vibrio alginolyticus]